MREVIEKHTGAVGLEMREKGRNDSDLFRRLATEERLPLDHNALPKILANPLSLTCAQPLRIDMVVGH